MDRISRLRLGELVAESSVAEHEIEVARLVRAARRAGVDELAVSIAADPTAPAIARSRAVGRIAVALRGVDRDVARPRAS